MSDQKKKIRSAVRRENAESFLLISLVAFGVTVIAVRTFLQMTGFPQIGNSILHIAHAIWGGLLLFLAVLMPLLLANSWALQAGAILNGVGFGLFIDEVGKFITQTNDYFFPPALSLIYVFFLLILLLYLVIRQPRKLEPRAAMYQVLEGLKEALDGDLDTAEGVRIEKRLSIARQSDQEEISVLAGLIMEFVSSENERFQEYSPGFWNRLSFRVDRIGKRVGRRFHRNLISCILILWLLLATGYIIVLIVQNPALEDQVVRWRSVLLVLQGVIGIMLAIATVAWLSGHEERGLGFALAGFLFSLVALQSVYFFLSQFQAITFSMIQLFVVLILMSYRRWYLRENNVPLPPTHPEPA